ncbi:MAG: hypothetical protein JSS87_12615 [Acidobacteria bacterium]|nr:hypothetical protein [Acidobacteriota bacterium]
MLISRRLVAHIFLLAAITVPAFAQPHIRPITVYLPQGKIQVVRVVSPGGAMQRIGLLKQYTAGDLEMKPDDLIFAIDGIRVDSAERFTDFFSAKTQNANIRIDFLRDGVVHQAVGPLFRFTRGVLRSDKPKWGGQLETTTVEFTPALFDKPVVRTFTVFDIAHVKADSAAGGAGLRKGDLLVSVNGRFLGHVNRDDIIIPLFPEGTPLTFTFLRDGKMQESTAVLKQVRQGFTKFLSFGFTGATHMAEVPSTDHAEPLPHDVMVEMPTQ